MDGTAVSSESKYPPLFQAKRKIEDTAVSSESKNPPLVQAKDKSEETPWERALRCTKIFFPPGFRTQRCCDGDGLTDSSYGSSNDDDDDDDDEPPVRIGKSLRVPIHLENFVEKMTSGSGPHNEKTNSVLVTNLPYLTGCRSTNNGDLMMLFSPYGATDAHVAVDEIGIQGCFGFVKFGTKEEAQKAIDKAIDGGFVHCNFTLGVEWVTPKTT